MPQYLSEFRIYKAGAEDADVLGLVSAMAWQEAYADILPAEYLKEITPELRAHLFRADPSRGEAEHFLARVDGEPAGFLVLRPSRENCGPRSGEVEAIYLRAAYWGKGYGAKLMEFALDHMRKSGYERAVLWTLEKNVRAGHFNEHCGFMRDGCERSVELGIPFTEVRYSKML